MPRTARGPIPAGMYHVWRRTTGPQLMFRDDHDRTVFCNRLASTVSRFNWTCIGFVLMPTHFHLVLDIPEDALGKGMHHLWAPYAQGFNWRWARSGHLRAGPYKHRGIESAISLRRTYRYVARNPVEAKLCKKPGDWVWSSYPGSAGYARRFPFVDDRLLLESLHDDAPTAQVILRDFVETP